MLGELLMKVDSPFQCRHRHRLLRVALVLRLLPELELVLLPRLVLRRPLESPRGGKTIQTMDHQRQGQVQTHQKVSLHHLL
jgi:hypothetical protein